MAPSQKPHDKKPRGALIVVVVLVALVGGLALATQREDDPPAPDATTAAPAAITLPAETTTAGAARFSTAQRAAIRRDQQAARGEGHHDEPDPNLAPPATVTDVPSGPTGPGALGRSLPIEIDGWSLQLQSVNARRGVTVLTADRTDGQQTTPVQAARAVRRIARALADDPRAYEVLVPMSALKGAHAKEIR